MKENLAQFQAGLESYLVHDVRVVDSREQKLAPSTVHRQTLVSNDER